MNTITRARLASTTAMAVLGLAVLSGNQASAQSGGETTTLEAVVVTGTKRPQDDASLPVATTILGPENVKPSSPASRPAPISWISAASAKAT